MSLNNWKMICRNAKSHFQMMFSLSLMLCLLKLPNMLRLTTIKFRTAVFSVNMPSNGGNISSQTVNHTNDHKFHVSIDYWGCTFTPFIKWFRNLLTNSCKTILTENVSFLSNYLKLAFKDLYRPESTREEGTLKNFREKLKRKNVSADVKNYEGCEQFFESVGRYT